MNIFKVFSLLYLSGLIIFLFIFDHSKNIYLILILQIFIMIYFIYIKKFKEIIVILVVFYIAEFILLKSNIFHKHPDSLKFNIDNKNIYDSSSVIKYLYVNKFEPLNLYDQKFVPLTNLANSKIYNGRVGNNLSFLNSDELGFFNLYNDNIYNYIFLGDSFLNFAEIEIENSFVYLMENLGIYNMSIANSGPLTQFAILKEFIDLPKFKNVSKIIWFHSEENDLARPYIELKNKGGDLNIEYSLTLLKKYLNNQDYKQNIHKYFNEINLKLKNDKLVKNYNKNTDIKKNFFLINFFSNSFYYIRKLNNQNKDKLIRKFNEDKNFYNKQIEIMNKISVSLKKYLDERNINLIVVILPDKFNCLLNKKHFLNQKLITNFELNGIKYIDGKKAFIKKNKCEINNFNRYGHFSKKGHKNMSNYLKQKVIN